MDPRRPTPKPVPSAPTEPPDTLSIGLAATDSNALTFLAPPQAADELGWLGPYRVLGELGHGGMGMVFRAEDPQLKRQIALKVMLPRHAADPLAKKRFLREAEAQAAVEHDHITPIFQVGEDRGTPYIAMPLLKGHTLATELKATPRLHITEVLRIGREITEGLAAAHEKGLIHRDIKPGNVWLEGERRRVKILDFGLARAETESGGNSGPLTALGVIVGSPSYMSPEQARGETVDPRTDLFSLGVVLYQMATGYLPFTGKSQVAILAALTMNHPRPPRDLAPDLPPSLCDLILRLLAKNPAGRPHSAQVVAYALHQHELALSATMRTLPIEPRPEAVPEVWSHLAETEPDEVVHRPAPLIRKSGPIRRETRPASSPELPAPNVGGVPLWWWAVAALVLMVVILGTVLVLTQVIRVTTAKGTLEIESTDPDVEVIVKQDDAVIVDKTKQREIELKVGDGDVGRRADSITPMWVRWKTMVTSTGST